MLRRNLTLFAVVTLSLAAAAQDQRHFAFHYGFTVKNVPPGSQVRVWFPLAHSDPYQDVTVRTKDGDLKFRQTEEQEYGNALLFAEDAKSARSEYKFAVDYDVVRREHVALVDGKLAPGAHPEKPAQPKLARYLEPDRLVPTTGLPAQLAVEQTRAATTPLEKARALYDYVFTTMRYDKSGTGWGHGDTLWACDSKRQLHRLPFRIHVDGPLPAHPGAV